MSDDVSSLAAWSATRRGRWKRRKELMGLLGADDRTVFPATDPAATVLVAGHPGPVDTVLVAGHVVIRHGNRWAVDLPCAMASLLEPRNRIAAAAGIALDRTWSPHTETR